MAISTLAFLDLLEKRGIMAPDHVDHLREQVAEAGVDVHPVHVARKLVEAGYLNPFFAKTLLEESRSAAKAGPSRPMVADELELAPLEEEQRRLSLASPVPVELNIDLPPIRDPDEWPSPQAKVQQLRLAPAPGPLNSPLPTANDLPLARPKPRRKLNNSHWIPWAIAAAAVLVALVLLVISVAR